MKAGKRKGIVAAASVLAASGLGGATAATAAAAPTSTTPPTITGSASYGHTLSCRNGTWSAGAGSFAYRWQLADGNVVVGSRPTLRVRAVWVALGIDCVVTAKDSSGSTTAATSAPVSVTPATPRLRITRTSVSSRHTVRLSGTITPTASLNGGAGSLILYRQTPSGLEQLSFNGGQTHPPRNGRFTITAAAEPVGSNTYVLVYVPSSIGYVAQVTATRRIRVGP